mgnify:CR=1 FL=1
MELIKELGRRIQKASKEKGLTQQLSLSQI